MLVCLSEGVGYPPESRRGLHTMEDLLMVQLWELLRCRTRHDCRPGLQGSFHTQEAGASAGRC